jgi:hypothetical protein
MLPGGAQDPNYKFSEVAQPYAAELLQLDGGEGRNGALLLEQVRPAL